jgi:hypothetical protein
MWTFTTYTYDQDALRDFRTQFPAGLKGVEIQTDSHDVFNRDIRHALNQMRYAMPDLLMRHITATLFGHPDDCKPIFILPFIVTTAELRVLNEDVSLTQVRYAETLDQISTVVPILDVHSPHAADFREHCAKAFAALTARLRDEGNAALMQIAKHYREQGKDYISPISDLQLLGLGYGPDPGFFTQFLIVNLVAVPSLLAEVNAVVENSLRNSKQFIFAAAKQR